MIRSKLLKKSICLSIAAGCILLAGSGNIVSAKDAENSETLYQVALLQSLTAGQYDGVVTVEELAGHGDIGIGTFEGVNGEMIVIDGKVYQALGDGSVMEADAKETVPFATVTYMDEDIKEEDFKVSDIEGLKEKLNALVEENGANHFYMVRIDGTCDSILVRSELKQEKPYKPLDQALATDQREFTYEGSKGSIVGLYCPPYMNMLNTAGWHFHYITEDKSQGGHILGVTNFDGSLSMDRFSEFDMVCPDNEMFNELDLTVDQEERIKDVEQKEEK